jgi:hypothetical protein
MGALIFILVFCLILIIGIAILAVMLTAKRRKNLCTFATNHRLIFRGKRDYALERRFPAFACLKEGSHRYGYNVMTGDWRGRHITAFDWHYQVQNGKNTTHYNFSAVVLGSPVPLKPLLIRREHLGDKLKAFFGFDDIDFESAEFSRRFFVSSTDRKWAYDVLHQRTIEYLMTAPEFSVQFGPDCAIAWRHRIFTADEFAVAADHLRNILELLPEWLVRQQQGA